MKIAIDIDNTVFTNNSIVYRLLNNIQVLGKAKDTKLKYKSVKKTIPPRGFIKRVVPFFNPSKYTAFKDAAQVINFLFNNGHEIIFLSNRPTILTDSTLELLDMYDIKYDSLILGCKNKHMFCKEFEIDVLIDDQLKTCTNVAQTNTHAICFNPNLNQLAPANKSVEPNLFHAKSWKAVNQLIGYIDRFGVFAEGINVLNSDFRESKLVEFFRASNPLYKEIIFSKYAKDHILKTTKKPDEIAVENFPKVKLKMELLETESLTSITDNNSNSQQKNT